MKTYSIFETHAHYDDEAFEPDRDGLLSSLQGNGIGTVVNVCASVGELGRTIALTEKYPFVYGAVGVHPDDADKMTEQTLNEIDIAEPVESAESRPFVEGFFGAPDDAGGQAARGFQQLPLVRSEKPFLRLCEVAVRPFDVESARNVAEHQRGVSAGVADGDMPSASQGRRSGRPIERFLGRGFLVQRGMPCEPFAATALRSQRPGPCVFLPGTKRGETGCVLVDPPQCERAAGQGMS